MKKILMKYMSFALVTTLLTSCTNIPVTTLDTNQNLNHQIPKGFTGKWTEKKPTKNNCYPASDFLEYELWTINPKKQYLELATAFEMTIYHFTTLSDTEFSAKAKQKLFDLDPEIDPNDPSLISYRTISGKILNKNQIVIDGKKLNRCPKSRS